MYEHLSAWIFLKTTRTVELHLSGINGTASHPDIQKIRIIEFFFETRPHWRFEVRLLLFTVSKTIDQA